MRLAEWIIAGLQGILGVALLIGSRTLSPGKGGDPGPWVWPAFLGIMCLATAGALALHAVRLDPDQPSEVNGRWRLALSGIVFAGVYLGSVPFLGYFLATPLMIPSMVWYLGVRSPRWVIGSTAGFTLFAWLLFYYFFRVPLPAGLLGFLG